MPFENAKTFCAMSRLSLSADATTMCVSSLGATVLGLVSPACPATPLEHGNCRMKSTCQCSPCLTRRLQRGPSGPLSPPSVCQQIASGAGGSLRQGVNQGEKWGTRHAQVQRSLGSVAWPQDQPKEGQGAGGGGSPKW